MEKEQVREGRIDQLIAAMRNLPVHWIDGGSMLPAEAMLSRKQVLNLLQEHVKRQELLIKINELAKETAKALEAWYAKTAEEAARFHGEILRIAQTKEKTDDEKARDEKEKQK